VPSNGITHPKKRAFLAAYAESGNISAACRAIGIERHLYYHWCEHDDVFVAAAGQAYVEAGDKLEQFAREWATLGIPTVKEVYERAKVKRTVEGGADDGAVVVEDALVLVSREVAKNINPTLLIFLLKGAKPEKYRETRDPAAGQGVATKAFAGFDPAEV
jgi:hypothetical protein